uniref:PH domain-containing protein n=1 Tax=Palpitomonas bilix TaxID=652834 RepID=A0A7S3GBK4_9EUKA|mmetsp:Transcript_39593/g.101654  ORF Transcript_39593/g.101654 Transcript_39593/m.101654 type:complete len:243 (+) Transcript_39593:88-816(+)
MSGVDEKEEKDSQEVEEVEKDGDDVDEKEEEDDEEHSLAQAHRLAQEFWRAQDGTAAKAGYLEKKGGGAGKKRNWRRGGRRNWKKRWFVLQESILYYFPSEEETNSPLGMVKLKKYEITSEESSRKITLVAGQQDERSYEMKALSPSDYTEWCDVLSSVIEKNKHAPAKRIAEATTTYIDSSEQVLLRIPTQAIPEYSLFHVSKATLGGRRYRKSKPFVFQDTNMLLLTERNIYIFDVQMAR